eukprot:TRINITY_DN3202_c0_g1_i2.p1 TRINITY_DN3202_c0_g1~~TRINITY_DN3202_c0_g1_i2.p1  ORF type:complete len:160 (+),score=22.45 TRINITY_DN3202_c0_g1_i2:87-566(+)
MLGMLIEKSRVVNRVNNIANQRMASIHKRTAKIPQGYDQAASQGYTPYYYPYQGYYAAYDPAMFSAYQGQYAYYRQALAQQAGAATGAVGTQMIAPRQGQPQSLGQQQMQMPQMHAPWQPMNTGGQPAVTNATAQQAAVTVQNQQASELVSDTSQTNQD